MSRRLEIRRAGRSPGAFQTIGLSSGFSRTLVLIPRIFDPLGGSGKPAFPKLRFLQPLPIEIGHSPGNVAPVPTLPASGSVAAHAARDLHISLFSRKSRREGYPSANKHILKSAVFSHSPWELFFAILAGFYLPGPSQN